MFFLALFYIKILKQTKKILIIIQRSNGDVFLSTSLINNLFNFYKDVEIDLLINDDTYPLAKILPNINYIHKFSYEKKQNNQFNQEKNLFISLFKKYDLSINLTASDRSVIYAFLAGRIAISAIEKNHRKSWWKKKLLNHFYYFDSSKHILINNLEPLRLLKIKYDILQHSVNFSSDAVIKIKSILENSAIKRFLIFHPSAQYSYKVYPKNLRNKLLKLLNTLQIPIIITGGNSDLDLMIKKEIPSFSNVYELIGETSLEEYIVLSKLSLAYVGMDTLNMHISASQNKRIFAIFGPSKLSMWSPWSNHLKRAALTNKPVQTYGENTIFQSSLPCENCGIVGCGNIHGKKEFVFDISPEIIFDEVKNWIKNSTNS